MKQKNSKIEKKVLDFLEEMDFMFGIGHFEKKVTFHQHDSPENFTAQMSIEFDYQRVYIEIYPDFMTRTSDQQRLTLLHELSHSLVAPLCNKAENLFNGKVETLRSITHANEEVTSKIQNILHKLLTGKLQYAHKAYSKYLK